MRYFIAVLVVMALSAPAWADLMLQYEGDGGESTVTMYVKGDRMRMENAPLAESLFQVPRGYRRVPFGR